ncbi:phthiocerol/phthiodiolone dimycocerosyl transferase family protein [Jiangella ureilytica]|nr:hypothetical protein [Jiangella ureilytica]
MQRPLDELEVQLRSALTYFAEFSGSLDEDRMARAFHLLCAEFPVLRAQIRSMGTEHLLSIPLNGQPSVTFREGGMAALREEADRQWTPEQSVVRLIIIQGREVGYVGLRTDHAVADGHATMVMFGELWRLYTDIGTGKATSVEVNSGLPRPPLELLEERWGVTEPARPGLALEPAQASVLVDRYISLSEGVTAELIKTGRSLNLTVHALVSGAILVALRRRDGRSSAASMGCWTAVDLRDRVAPSVGVSETTNLLGVHLGQVAVARRDAPAEVGRAVKQQLDAALARREVRPVDLSSMLLSSIETELEPRIAQMIISNMGVMPELAHPTDITLRSVFRTAAPLASPAAFPEYSVYTYAGQLNIRCSYPSAQFSAEEAEEFAGETKGQLLRMVSLADS